MKIRIIKIKNIAKIWHLNPTAISIITGSVGTIKKNIRM